MASRLDFYDRKISYLRVSVTDRCNLRCVYCAPVKAFKFKKHAEVLQYEEILEIIRAARDLGINKVRLTGGEPLIRKDFIHLVKSVCRISGLDDVSITTNGVFLKKMAQAILDAGVHRLNVSLDTLVPLKYAKITGRDCFHDVWNGIEAAHALGFSPIKINVVAMKGINDGEIVSFGRLSLRKPYQIRFIEFMPIGNDGYWTPEKYVSSDTIKSKLESIGPLFPISSGVVDGPARRHCFDGAKGEVGFISPMSHRFCHACNRLRLTADGKVRPCLFGNEELDVKTPLREGCSRHDLKVLLQVAIDRKPKQHHAEVQGQAKSSRPMSAIGG
jgi:GTP 3',8-cyclase